MRSAPAVAARTILFPALVAALLLASNDATVDAAEQRPTSAPERTLAPPRSIAEYGLATTTVFLVRHAEKAAPGDPEFDADTPADPPLSAAGRARAEALAWTLKEAGITTIFASEFARTQQTVAPLAARLGLEVTVHPARDTAGLAELVTTAYSGGVVVICGHSNTVPALIEALGAGAVDPIEDAWEYDNLYIVVIEAPGEARVSTLKFGAASVER